ncbi:Asp-tRNA(Asn)/Glu-tRNA(Gln) amidotransferase subunit GatA [Mesoplasma seiffertii]|uniref:Asp-tRNA(Asn)/Glu-tRNA(Gln) amidotransferase subunit GatA n=1 Tax=Mesoplasma seiffertii TaxID=28224 RepID=UPI00047D2162|nr:Asp-tRNA(Asn)/Glu-tRNA(Gln) amidotransferase subunit GatA [Mesoplasma seiffertii]
MINYKKMTISQIHEALKNKTFSVTELTSQVIENLEQDWESNAVVTLAKAEALKNAQNLDQNFDDTNLLCGIPYLAKDNFSTKGIRTTSSSKILEQYYPVFDATVIKKMHQANTVMVGKTALDELGMGGTGLHSAYGKVFNPRYSKRLVGGSSSGSAYAVAKGYVPFATGTDTGDSIRKPASYNAIVGFKPTYGAISRYGILPYAPSLDTAGFFTRNVDDMAILAEASFGYDQKDFTSIDVNNQDIVKNLNNLSKTTKFGYIKEVHQALNETMQKEYLEFYKKLEQQGYEVQEISFREDLLEALAPVYMMISFSEAVSTNANLDGINFGTREPGADYTEIMTQTRAKNFGEIVKRRFIIGALNLRRQNQVEYLLKAKQVRRLIVEEILKFFTKADIMILPPAPGPAPLIEAAQEFDEHNSQTKEYLEDILIIANFAGLPSITIPFIEIDKMPVGINLTAQVAEDLKVLQAAKLCETLIGRKNEVVE